jgi:alpha-mannosidase
MGAAWLTEQTKPTGRRRSAPPLAEGLMLRNEFLEVHVDAGTGGLRVLRDYGARGNRMSQQLIHRRDDARGRRATSDDLADTSHSTMVADSCQVTQADAVVGEIVTRGRLQDSAGVSLAEFQQTFRLLRGSRVIELEIHLRPRVDLRANPWHSYFASRFAWASEAADLQRSYHELRCPTKARRLEAPLFVQVDDGAQKTTILTGGLPFHRRIGPRMLDTLLIVHGEIQRDFRLGIGVDLKQPVREALGMLLPTVVIDDLSGIPNTQSAWLVHLNARNALVTGCEPRWKQDRVVGACFHVAEIDGRSTSVCLRTFRPVSSARKIDAAEQTVSPCDVREDEVRFALASRELTVIEVSFTDTA